MEIYTYSTVTEGARRLIEYLIGRMECQPGRVFYFAFSGGNMASLTFDVWAHEYADKTPWERMCIYWVDECCVPFNDSESNFGTMRRLLLDRMETFFGQLFPIYATYCPPEEEARRYSDLVCRTVPLRNGLPSFDAVLLDVGDDGRTASIFSGQEQLLVSCRPYVVSANPYDGQLHITMTGPVLLNAKRLIFFLADGYKTGGACNLLSSGDTCPAAYVAHHAQDVWVLADDKLI